MAAHILIIEDEEKLARFVELELVHEGYQVSRSGGNGREGLRMAEENSYDLLLLDIMLPGTERAGSPTPSQTGRKHCAGDSSHGQRRGDG